MLIPKLGFILLISKGAGFIFSWTISHVLKRLRHEASGTAGRLPGWALYTLPQTAVWVLAGAATTLVSQPGPPCHCSSTGCTVRVPYFQM